MRRKTVFFRVLSLLICCILALQPLCCAADADLDIYACDIKKSDWFYPYVEYVLQADLMSCVAGAEFQPDALISRSVFLSALYRMESRPAVDYEPIFSDVFSGQDCADAVIWAAKNGLATGMENGVFCPDSPITRQDAACMLYRFARLTGNASSASTDLSAYLDADQVSSYAADAMRWAVGRGILFGSNLKRLNPKTLLTRAETAVMLYRLLSALTPASHAVFLQDISAADWFYPYVEYALNADLMSGITAAEFQPNEAASRVVFLSALYRMEASPAVEYEPLFSDVSAGQYGSDAVIWAVNAGLVTGMGSGLFCPDAPITRQDAVCMLYRYAQRRGIALSASADLHAYTDAGRVREYAADAMRWAVGGGILLGDSQGRLNPTQFLTRAETAVIFHRFSSFLRLMLPLPEFRSDRDELTHRAYCTLDGEFFRPNDALTCDECRQMLQSLYGCALPVGSSGSAVSLSTFYDSVCTASKDTQKAETVFRGLNLCSNEPVSRLEAVILLNAMTDRVPDGTRSSRYLVLLDLPLASTAYSQVLEAVTDHTAVFHGLHESWTEDDLEQKAIAPGLYRQENGAYLISSETNAVVADGALHLYGGKVVFAGTDGTLLRNASHGGMFFGSDCFYTTRDAALDAEVETVLASCTNSSMSQEEKLRACFDYVRAFQYLGRNPALPRSAKYFTAQQEISFARKIFETGKGDCYNFAASFCCLARALGFEAVCVAGTCLYSWNSVPIDHGWVEIPIGGQTWLFDPEIENYNNRSGISNMLYGAFRVSYGDAPGRYYKN